MHEELTDALRKRNIQFKEYDDLSVACFMKCGGYSSLTVIPSSIGELVETIRIIRKLGHSYVLIGSMSNVLPKDGLNNFAIIKTGKLRRKSVAEESVHAECGTLLSSVVSFAIENGLGGCEGLGTIPGTVGGAIYGNSGAFGSSFENVFLKGLFFDPINDNVISLAYSDMLFGYRSSVLSCRELVLLSAEMKFLYNDPLDSGKKLLQYRKKRLDSQPTNYPSLGSVFKRVGDKSAGFFIDQCGLKGLSIGGACISPKHAGFIVNRGNASSNDVKHLIEIIKNNVYLQFSVELQEEIRIL